MIRVLLTIGILSLLFLAGGFFFLADHPWVDFSPLVRYNAGKPSIVLDDEGYEWARFQLDKRDPIKLERVPLHVIRAFLAAEDRHFYEHAGLSLRGIVRSVFINLYHRRRAQGASTITQQLVRLLFFDVKKTFTRKLKEQLLTIIVERQFTKDQILEIYLNHVCFGCGIFGIETAAQRFWNKHVSDLSIDEAAVLAGIIRSPRKYCPLDNPHNALCRRNVVLNCMLSAGYIDQESCHELTKKPLQLIPQDIPDFAPHAREMVRIFLEDLVGKHMLYSGGLIIQTTLNRDMQAKAARTFNAQVHKIRKQFVEQADGGLLCIESNEGGIKALVGGYHYKTSQFNRAMQARRQMGSIFKPLIYTAALDRGMQLTDIKIDQPISYVANNTVWEPKNVQKRFDGPMTLAYALMRSNNSIPIQIVLEMGTEKIIEYAQACNIAGPLYPYPSLALGCVDGTLYEAVGMFNIFNNKGTYVQPYLVKWVKDAVGNKIWKHAPLERPIIDWSKSSQVAKTLSMNVPYWKIINGGVWPSCETLGKTGTTNDARTCWFVGSIPQYTTGIYIGCDDNRPMGRDVFAMRTALPMWAEFTSAISQPGMTFNFDPRLTEVRVHCKTGKLLHDSADLGGISLLVTDTKNLSY